MKNQDYIASLVRTGKIGDLEAKESKGNSLIFKDGVLFSYAEHYPLLFKVKGFIFCNTRGYSSTTAKHICYSNYLADFDVKLRGDDCSLNDVIISLRKERRNLKSDIKKLSSRAWRQKEIAESRIDKINEALRAIDSDTEEINPIEEASEHFLFEGMTYDQETGGELKTVEQVEKEAIEFLKMMA